MSYYFTADGKNVQGPTDLQQLAAWVREQKLPPNLHVCEAGGQEWKQISAVVPAIHLAPQQAPAASPITAAPEPVSTPEPEPVPVERATQPASAEPAQVAQATTAAGSTAAQDMVVAETSTALATKEESRPSRVESTPAEAGFDALAIASKRPVNAKDHVSKGTGLHSLIGFLVFGLVSLIGFGYIAFFTLGIGLVVMAILYWLNVRRGHTRIHGGAVHVTPDQFPEIYRCTQDFAKRLNMKTVPEVYVVEGSVLNAFAAKLGKRKYVLLLDDLVHGCLLANETKALAFIIGHELAHHALGHTGLIRSSVSATYKPLSRCDEMSCDSVAADLVEDKEVCARGLGMLLIGPQLVGKLNWKALDNQARELMSKKTWKGAESSMSHPLLLRRYAHLRGH